MRNIYSTRFPDCIRRILILIDNLTESVACPRTRPVFDLWYRTSSIDRMPSFPSFQHTFIPFFKMWCMNKNVSIKSTQYFVRWKIYWKSIIVDKAYRNLQTKNDMYFKLCINHSWYFHHRVPAIFVNGKFIWTIEPV